MHTSIFLAIVLVLAILLPAAQAQTYQYDTAGRLVAAINDDGSQFRYGYDANGNVTRIQHLAGGGGPLPPDGVIDTPDDDIAIDAGSSVNFTGSGADPDGALPLTYLWTFDGAAADSNDEDPGDVTFATAGTYDVEFIVTDATGLADPTPDTVTVTVTAVTSGGGGGSGGGNNDSGGGGGGAMSWLLLLALCARRLRIAMAFAALALAATQAFAQSWEPMGSPVTGNLNAVWAEAADNVWAVGNNGTVLHFDGANWQIDGFTGTSLNLTGVFGYAPNDIWVVGDDGYVAHYDGSGWDVVDIGAGPMDLVDVWSAGPGESLFVVGLRGAWEMSAGTWTRRSFRLRLSATLTPPASLTGIGGTADDVLITAVRGSGSASDGGFYHNFREIQDWELQDAWAASPTEMFVAGAQSQRLNGDPGTLGDWQAISPMPQPLAVWGSGTDNVYAVGRLQTFTSMISHYDGNAGNTWTTELTLPIESFRDIDGVDATNIFVVGSNGIVYRYSEPAPTPSAANFPYAGNLGQNINAHTGELTHVERDFALGQVFPIVFERYYASGLGDRQLGGRYLGRNWSHSYEWRINTNYEGNPAAIRVADPRGREFVFLADGGGWRLETPGWAVASLVVAGDNYLFVDQESERIVAFWTSDERPNYIEDRNGNRHTFNYVSGFLSAIVDNFGNRAVFEYNAGNRLGAVYVPGNGGVNGRGLEVQFGYDKSVLSTVTTPGDISTTYDYIAGRESEALMVARWRGGNLQHRWTYDAQNRVATSWPTDGDDYEFAYNGNTVTVTLPDNTTTRDLVHNDSGALVSEEDGLGGIDRFEYDANGRRSAWIDRAGRRTAWTHHLQSGKVSRIVQPGNFTWDFTLAPGSSAASQEFHDVVHVRYPDDSSVAFDVDNFGNVTRFEDQEDHSWSYTHDAHGGLVTATNPLGGATIYERDNFSNLDSVTDPSGNVLQVGYDRMGRLLAARYADNRQVLVSWGDRLSPESLEFEAGSVIDFSYDATDRLVTTTRSDGASATFNWFDGGRLESVTTGDGGITRYTYDTFRRLQTVTSALNIQTGYRYNFNGQLENFTDGDGFTWGVVYDADGFPRTVRLPTSEVVEFDNSMDSRGLLTSVSEGNGSLRIGWDAVSRVVKLSDPLERVINVQRDLRGLVTSRSLMPAGFTTSYARNPLGDVTQMTDPIGGSWQRDYDEAGRLASTTDPLGETTTFAYDNRNRVATVTRADNSTATFAYDGTGGISDAQYSDGTEVVLDRSPQGRLMGGTNLVLGYSTAGNLTSSNGIGITYDSDDRLESMTLAPGRTLDYRYDGRGNLLQITDWMGGETQFVSDDRGRVKSVALPNGVTTRFAWDRASRIDSIDFGSLGSIVLSRSPFGQVQSAARSLPGPQVVTPVDRQFSFDLASQIDAFAYDARGNLTRDAKRDYAYDGANRLRDYAGDDGAVRLTYDALGNIVASDGPVSDRQYTLNYAHGKARVAVESNGAGQALWYYVYTDDGDLLYRVNPDAERQFYHFDENGNTVFMTDDTATVIATWFYSPLGEVVDSSGTVDNDRKARAQQGGRELGGTTTLSLGLTYADPLTGHGFTRFDAPMLEEQAPDESLAPTEPFLRLPQEPVTSIEPPTPAIAKALQGAAPPPPPRARALTPAGVDPVHAWLYSLMFSQTLELIYDTLPPLPGKLVETPRAEKQKTSRERFEEEYDNRDEDSRFDRDDDDFPPFAPTNIRPPGYLPKGSAPEPVESILKEVRSKLVLP